MWNFLLCALWKSCDQKIPISLSTLCDNIQLLHRSATKASNRTISRGKKVERKEVANASTALLPKLQEMYWSGVERELRDIILTLKAWEHRYFDSIVLDDEKDAKIYGFDTFIDQVNETSRELAVLYGKKTTTAARS